MDEKQFEEIMCKLTVIERQNRKILAHQNSLLSLWETFCNVCQKLLHAFHQKEEMSVPSDAKSKKDEKNKIKI